MDRIEACSNGFPDGNGRSGTADETDASGLGSLERDRSAPKTGPAPRPKLRKARTPRRQSAPGRGIVPVAPVTDRGMIPVRIGA